MSKGKKYIYWFPTINRYRARRTITIQITRWRWRSRY